MSGQTTKQSAAALSWLQPNTRVAVLVQGQGVRGGTVTEVDDKCVQLRWDVGVWTQEPGARARVDQFDLSTLTDTAGWIRARILTPQEGVPAPAEPVIRDQAELTRWPYVELPVAVTEYPCTVPDCDAHSTGEPFDPGRELLSWLRAALSGVDSDSALFPKLASRLSYAHNASRPEGLSPLGDAYGAFAFTHVPLVDAAEFAALPTWTVTTEPADPTLAQDGPTLAQLQGLAQECPDEGVLLDLDVRPAEALAQDQDPGPDTTWLIRVTNAYDLNDLPR